MQAFNGKASGDEIHLVGFTIGNEDFGVDILKVQEIIRMVEITKIPSAPDFVEGVINLRGTVIPVIDFRKRFHLDETSGEGNCSRRIVVGSVNGVTIGVIVDKVSQVMKLKTEQVSEIPDIAHGIYENFIRGVGMLGEKLLIILDLEKLFTLQELAVIAQAA